MKKILLVATTLLLSVSVAFGVVHTAGDLVDLYGANALRLGVDSDYWDAGVGTVFGTDKLRFSVQIDQLNTWFNNAEIQEESTMPVLQGLPRFYVGAGYNMGDHKVAIGYGLTKKWDATNTLKPGWVGNEIGVFYQGQFGANRIRIYSPIQFGFGTGKTEINDHVSGDKVNYNNKNVEGFYAAPQIRWYGNVGKLTQIRFAVPFDAYEKKSLSYEGTKLVTNDNTSAIGADLRVYFTMATDPVVVRLIPRVIYNTAIKGNQGPTSPMGKSYGDMKFDIDGLTSSYGRYELERPWDLRADLEIDFESGNDFLSIWAGAKAIWKTVGAPKIKDTRTDKIRKEAIHTLGYDIDMEMTLKFSPALTADIGFGADGTLALNATGANGVGLDAGARINWFF